MCQKKQSRAPVPLLHLPYISTPRQIPSQADTTMLRVLSYVEEATPGKRLPWIPHQQETRRAGVFSKVFQLTGSTHCSALGLAELWEGPCGSGDVDPPQGVLQWGLHAGTTSLAASTPPCPALASGMFKLQKSVTRPGAQDLMEITLAFCFFF